MGEKKKRYKQQSLRSIIIGILLGFGIWYIVFYYQDQNFSKQKESVITNITTTGEFTNPAINYEYGANIMDNKEINLEKPIQDFIEEKQYNNETNHVSVYYRNLNNGNVFGINEKEMFSPASLMKLPLLLVYLKKIEANPSLWDQKIIYTQDPVEAQYTQNIEPREKLVVGESYTIKKLLENMIQYSDNESSIILERNIQIADYKKAFTDNNMLFPEIIDGRFDNNLKVVDYARFFRVLFNASYVNQELSNYALWLLTKVDFINWLVAGVEKNIPVAHKFGERWIIWTDGIEQKQLHDCGIIYYPKHPYVLCIMTRGYDLKKLENIVSDISKSVYQEIQEKYRKKQ